MTLFYIHVSVTVINLRQVQQYKLCHSIDVVAGDIKLHPDILTSAKRPHPEVNVNISQTDQTKIMNCNAL